MPTDFPVSWIDIHRVAKTLADRLRATGQKWNGVIAVTRGGMVPACLVARDLDIRVIDTVSVQSYNHQTQSSASITKSPQSIVGSGQGWLIIDDLSDTGNTFKLLRGVLPDATYACLYAKPEGKPTTDFYATEVAQDCWIYFPWEDQDFPPHIRAVIGQHLL